MEGMRGSKAERSLLAGIVLATWSCAPSAPSGPTPLACVGGQSEILNALGTEVPFDSENGGCDQAAWTGTLPAGSSCEHSTECAGTCCSCGPARGFSATAGFCDNGVCADANTTCCAFAAQFQTNPRCAAQTGASGDSGSGSSDAGVTGTPACTSDGGLPRTSAVPAFGTFMGPALSGDICAAGAFAYLERSTGSLTTPSQLLLIIDSALSGNPSGFFQFTTPANAVGADLTILAGVSQATPGTYPSSGACGGVAFCVYLPVPPVDCGDASAPTNCPAGCDPVGPVSGPTCMPTQPEDCYVAQGASDCVYGTQTPEGSWSLTLTSVVPHHGADGGLDSDYVVHGTFATTMIGDDAGLGTANLSVNF